MRALLLAALFLSSSAWGLSFKRGGETVTALLDANLRAGRGPLPVIELEVHNIWRSYQRTYRGYDFLALLDAVYGPKWREAKRITFMSSDGYQQVASVPGMLAAAQGKRGLLAFGERGRQNLTPVEKGGKKIDPGPFYLVWAGFALTDKGSHGDSLKWPYSLSLIRIDE